ncbi:MAG: preprotein translocase subunit SecE [Janthinobacterium lividum]
MAKAIAVAEDTGIGKAKGQVERLSTFLGDVRSELRKTSTPSKTETRTTTTVVIFTVFAFAAYFWAVDYGINHTLNALITKLTQQH